MKVDTLILLINGERIVDVVPIQAERQDPGSYSFGKQEIQFDISFTADDEWDGWRIVYELPDGCFEQDLSSTPQPDDTLSLVFDGDGVGPTPLRACERPRAFTESLSTNP